LPCRSISSFCFRQSRLLQVRNAFRGNRLTFGQYLLGNITDLISKRHQLELVYSFLHLLCLKGLQDA
jgi:hypothetical protein